MQDADEENMHMKWRVAVAGVREGKRQCMRKRRAERCIDHEPDAGICSKRVLMQSKQSRKRRRGPHASKQSRSDQSYKQERSIEGRRR